MPSAAATGGSVKKYDACLQYVGSPSCSTANTSGGVHTSLPGGSSVPLQLTLTNQAASRQSLGSANINAPAGLPIDTLKPVTSSRGTFTTTSSQLKLRDLYMSPGSAVVVTFYVTTPCSGSGFTWTIPAKQSNNFYGTGNDFTLINRTGLVSDISGCKLVWGTQPTNAAANTVITGAAFTPDSPAKVTVRAVDDSNNTVAISGPTVTLNQLTGTFTSTGTGFSETTATLTNGVATFPIFQSDRTGTGFTFGASSPSFISAGSSGSFNISLAGTACSGSCTLQASLGENDDTQVGVTGSGTTFLAIDASEIPASVTASGGGCENYRSLGNAAFEVTGGWTGNTGVTQLKYTISNALLPDSHFPLFIPLCAGGQRLDGTGTPISCVTEENAGKKGWLGKALGSNHWFNLQYRYARCNPDDGLWWGILAPWFVVNSNVHPSVTSWYFSEGDTTTYAVKVPAPWDWKMG